MFEQLSIDTIDRNEKFTIKFFRRNENGSEYDKIPYATTKCRVATNLEKKEFRPIKGMLSQEESMYIVMSNMPKDINENDQVEFNGTKKLVKSVGYFYDESEFEDASILSDQYIIEKCKKGVQIG